MLELLAELTHLARRSPEISQRSGVSVRVSISNLEAVLANALKRAVRLGESSAAPRISDLGAVLPTTTGKIELETLNDEAPEERVVDRLLSKALYNVFGRLIEVDDLDDVVLAFEGGLVVETGESVASREYVRWSREIPGFSDAIRRLGGGASPASTASAVEFLLEGLHLHRRLNKDRGGVGGGGVYRR
jgi:magnesium chelatase subunit I